MSEIDLSLDLKDMTIKDTIQAYLLLRTQDQRCKTLDTPKGAPTRCYEMRIALPDAIRVLDAATDKVFVTETVTAASNGKELRCTAQGQIPLATFQADCVYREGKNRAGVTTRIQAKIALHFKGTPKAWLRNVIEVFVKQYFIDHAAALEESHHSFSSSSSS